MGRTRIGFLGLLPLTSLGPEQSRGPNRHDLVVVALQDESRHELLEVFREVRRRERLDAVLDRFVPAVHPLQPGRITPTLPEFRTGTIGAVKRRGQVLEERRTVSKHAGVDLVECVDFAGEHTPDWGDFVALCL